MASDADIDVETLRDALMSERPPFLLDVRETWEFELCRIPSAVLIPLSELPQRLAELPADRPIVAQCHHGGRSARAVSFLRQQGLSDVVNLAGGIAAWSERIDPSVKTYG